MFVLMSVSVLLASVGSSEVVDDKESVVLNRVESVVRGVARLPCDIAAPLENDHVTLIIWYRVGTDSPIYSVDARGKPLDQASHWADKALNGRAFFRLTDQTTQGQAKLALEKVNQTDAGSYKCRVDFKKSPTRNSFVNLTVIVPPKKLTILNEKREAITRPSIGPYSEGETVVVTCVASGGVPPPKVTWWIDTEVVDDSDEVGENGKVRNELLLKDLSRRHAGLIYTCHAVNNEIVPPIAADVRIDMYLKVLDVRLVGENLSLSAGSEYEIACQATGSRPPAAITWWKAGQLLEHTREKTSPDGNITVSTLTMVPTVDDLGKSLSCRASNPHVPGSAREDTWMLDVHYAPQVRLTLGSNINASSIREGVDVYFECSVRANPWIRFVTWQHSGRNLTNNASAGIIIANQTLVLQSVTRQNSGHYTCSAANSEGSAESNSFHLDVKYEPQCRGGQQRVYGAARNEAITVSCEVDSNPSATLFRWTFNNSLVRSKDVDYRATEEEGRSIATYTPTNEQGYGTLLCWGRNELGPQMVPCVFHIVPAGRPDPPKNCTLKNKTQTSLFVSCLRGFDGGLPQEFILEVYDIAVGASKPGRLIVNTTSRVVPEFSIGSLEPGRTYFLTMYSSNDKGRSSSGVSVRVNTLRPTQQEHRRNIPMPPPSIGFLTSMSPFVWISIGVVSGVSIIAITIIVILRLRGATLVCCCESDDEDTQHSSSGAESAEDPTKLTVNLANAKTPPQHISQDEVLEMDERNPDVIPLKNDVEPSGDQAEGEGRTWKAELHGPQAGMQFEQFHNFQRTGNKGNSAYEIPAPIDKWVHQMPWPSDQSGPQPQYNIVLNKQNMVLVEPALTKVQPNPIVFTTLSIDPAVLAPPSAAEPTQSPSDVPLNPCILLNQKPEALLATIPENLQVFAQSSDRTKLYNTLPSRTRQQNAETQTPLVVRHKESAV